MSQSKTITGLVLVVSLFFSNLATAKGGGLAAGSTEFTQIANNVELVSVAAESAATASTTARQYLAQIEQWKIQMRDIKKLASLPQGVEESVKAYDSYKDLTKSLTKLNGSLNAEKQIYDNRFNEARLYGKGWDGYVADVAKSVDQKNQKAQNRLKQEAAVMEQVNADYLHARKMQEKVPETDGVHGAVQLLNEQMNKLIVQNAQIMQLMASTTLRDAREKETSEALDLQSLVQSQDYLMKSQKQIRQRQLDFGTAAEALAPPTAKP